MSDIVKAPEGLTTARRTEPSGTAETAATCQLELALVAGPGARSRAAETDRGQSESESGLEQQRVPGLPALWVADHYLSPPKPEPKTPVTTAKG